MAIERLRAWLQHVALSPGSQLPAVRDLAGLLGTTRFATYEALQQLEREGVLRLMPGRIAVIVGDARGAAGGTAGPSAVRGRVVLVSNHASARELDLGSWRGWQQQLLQGVRAAARSARLELTLLPISAESLQRFDSLVLERPAGFIFLDDVVAGEAGPRLLAGAMASGLPVAAHGDVFAVGDIGRLRADLVFADHRGGATALVDWLAGRGRRRLLPWMGPGQHAGEGQRGLHYFAERLAGLREAGGRHGIEVLPCAPLLAGSGPAETPASFAEVVRLQVGSLLGVLETPHPVDAIAAVSDGLAYEAAAAVRLLGREPGRDLDIVGYDNSWSWCPQRVLAGSGLAATIEPDWAGIGSALVQMLAARIAGVASGAPAQRTVPAKLVIPT